MSDYPLCLSLQTELGLVVMSRGAGHTQTHSHLRNPLSLLEGTPPEHDRSASRIPMARLMVIVATCSYGRSASRAHELMHRIGSPSISALSEERRPWTTMALFVCQLVLLRRWRPERGVEVTARVKHPTALRRPSLPRTRREDCGCRGRVCRCRWRLWGLDRLQRFINDGEQ